MSEVPDRSLNAFGAYALVAFVGAAGSVFIALIAITKFQQVTDIAMWAIAVMVSAPAVMAVGVSYFVHKTSCEGRDKVVGAALDPEFKS